MNTITSTPARRPAPDRFLLAIVLGLVALLIIAGVAIGLSRQAAPLLPADTPGGTVQRFYVAIQQQDYDAAYALLSATLPDRPTQDKFVAYNLGQSSSRREQQDTRVSIKDAQISGSMAVVVVGITHYYNSGPFGGSNQWTAEETFDLQQEGAAWRITGLPYGYMPYPSR